MSTKNKTQGNNQTSFQFDQPSMDLFHQNIKQWLPFAQGLYQNPFGNQMFQQESSIGQDQAAHLGQRGVSNIVNNAAAMGYGTNGGMFNSMLARAGRDTSGLQAQAFRSAVMNANNRAMQGLAMSSAFQPLMTGSNSNFQQTQTTSGLGTWLPQVAGMALGGLTGGLGMGMMGGAAGGAGGGGGFTGSSFLNPANVVNPTMGGGNFVNTGAFTGGYGYGSGSSMLPPNPFSFGSH